MEQNTNANGANSWLDGISSGLNSITDTFAQIYGARAAYETIKQQNRTGYAVYDQNSMLNNVPRDQQVSLLRSDGGQAAADGMDWQKIALYGLIALGVAFVAKRVL